MTGDVAIVTAVPRNLAGPPDVSPAVKTAPRPRPALAAAAALAVAVLTACGPLGQGDAVSPPAAPVAAPPAPVLAATVGDGEISADAPVRVDAQHGTLRSVALTDASGAVVAALGGAAGSWSAPDVLVPSGSYTLTATATGADGRTTSLQRTFTTAPPARTLTTDVNPYGGRVVGVGQPLVVDLSAEVTDPQRRAAVERALRVTTSRPVGPASWAWTAPSRLQYRPQQFWPADTTVTLDVDLAGVQAGDDLWGVTSRQVSFRTGRAQVVTIDDATHTATVTVDGAVVRTMPVSLGKPGYTTRSGIKTVMSRHEEYRMRSATLGVVSGPEAYDLVVPYALRLTNSGEFFHGAPWATSRLGRENGSHGCTNLSVADAKWLYDHAQIGDPVVTVGTGRSMEPDNGTGGVWNVPWEDWTALSAL